MEATLKSVRSHTVTLDYGGGRGLQDAREECYPLLTVTVAGVEREVTVSADRYRDSEGRMSAWRWYVRDIDPGQGIGPTRRDEVRSAVSALVDGWLDGVFGTADRGEAGKYDASRSRAYRWAITNEIRNMRTTADYRARDALAKFSGELLPSDRDRMESAYEHMGAALHLLEGRDEA